MENRLGAFRATSLTDLLAEPSLTVTVLLVFVAAFSARSIQVIQPLFLVAGLAWALINVNAYPMLVEMASDAQTGTYTGLYYFGSSPAPAEHRLGPRLHGLWCERGEANATR